MFGTICEHFIIIICWGSRIINILTNSTADNIQPIESLFPWAITTKPDNLMNTRSNRTGIPTPSCTPSTTTTTPPPPPPLALPLPIPPPSFPGWYNKGLAWPTYIPLGQRSCTGQSPLWIPVKVLHDHSLLLLFSPFLINHLHILGRDPFPCLWANERWMFQPQNYNKKMLLQETLKLFDGRNYDYCNLGIRQNMIFDWVIKSNQPISRWWITGFY